jgi:hypothetical protein
MLFDARIVCVMQIVRILLRWHGESASNIGGVDHTVGEPVVMTVTMTIGGKVVVLVVVGDGWRIIHSRKANECVAFLAFQPQRRRKSSVAFFFSFSCIGESGPASRRQWLPRRLR